MIPAGADTARSVVAAHAPSIAILGADALVAALPATPVQLAHACLLASYQNVVPASWGDELIAAATLRDLATHGDAPVLACSCPLVARRLLALGADLRPFLISLVPPPVAAARYLRAVHGSAKVRITYVGRCPGAADDDIDARITPEELLATLADRGIVVEEQPYVFDSVLPPDRRRFCSQPGGLPTTDALWSATGGRTLVELERGDLSIELGQLLLSDRAVLVDVAPKLGCVCSGAAQPGVEACSTEARARVTALEPPRAAQPIVDEHVAIELEAPVPTGSRGPWDAIAPFTVTPRADMWAPADQPRRNEVVDRPSGPRVVIPSDAVTPGSRRRSPGHGLRAVVAAAPTTRDIDGRQLPRAYVARRRPTPRGLRAIADAAPNEEHRPATISPPDTATSDYARNSEAPIAAPTATASPAITTVHEPRAGGDTGGLSSLAIAIAIAVLALVSAAMGVVVGRLTR